MLISNKITQSEKVVRNKAVNGDQRKGNSQGRGDTRKKPNHPHTELHRSVEVAFFTINDIAIVITNMSPYITDTLLQLMAYFPRYLTLNLCLSLLN